MTRNMRRVLAFILTLCMVLTVLPGVALAKDYSDIEGHWGEDAIKRWDEAGIVGGIGNGEFAPNQEMTRSEIATVMVQLMVSEKKGDISTFTDIEEGSWYEDYIARAYAAKILNGTDAEHTTMAPMVTVTREQLYAILCNAFGIEKAETCKNDKKFPDLETTADWAKGYAYALVDMGVIGGMVVAGETILGPHETVTRAMSMSMLDNVIGVYANKDGEWTLAGVTEDGISQITLVVAENVSLKGTATDLPVVIAGKAAKVNLSGVKGEPTLYVQKDNVAITGAPVGTTVRVGDFTGVTVNGKPVDSDTTYVVQGSSGTGGGGGSTWNPIPEDINYTVNYYVNKDLVHTDHQVKGDKYTVATPDKEWIPAGSIFNGWKDNNGKEYSVGSLFPDNDVKDEDTIDLYAVLADITYTVKYNFDGKTEADPKGVKVGTPYTIKDPKAINGEWEAPAKKAFVGWTFAGTAYKAGGKVAFRGVNDAPDDVELIAEFIDTDDVIGIAVSESLDKLQKFTADHEDKVKAEGEYAFQYESGAYAIANKETESSTRYGTMTLSGTVETGLVNHLIASAASYASAMVGADTREDVDKIVDSLVDSLAGRFGITEETAGIRDTIQKIKDQVYNAVKEHGRDLWGTFKNKNNGKLYFDSVDISVGETTVTVDSERNLTLNKTETTRRAAATRLARAIFDDMEASLHSDKYKEFTSVVEPTAKVNLDFKASKEAMGGKSKYDYPTKYEFTVTTTLSSDGWLKYKNDDNTDRFQIIVTPAIEENYNTEASKFVNSLLEGEGLVGDLTTNSKLGSIQSALKTFSIEGVDDDAVSDAVTEWLKTNLENGKLAGTEYDNQALEELIEKLATGAAKKLNQSLEENAKNVDGGSIALRIVRAAAVPTGDVVDTENEIELRKILSVTGDGKQLLGDNVQNLINTLDSMDVEIQKYIEGAICDEFCASLPTPQSTNYRTKHEPTMKKALNETLKGEVEAMNSASEDKIDVKTLTMLMKIKTAKDVEFRDILNLFNEDSMLGGIVAKNGPTDEQFESIRTRFPENLTITIGAIKIDKDRFKEVEDYSSFLKAIRDLNDDETGAPTKLVEFAEGNDIKIEVANGKGDGAFTYTCYLEIVFPK